MKENTKKCSCLKDIFDIFGEGGRRAGGTHEGKCNHEGKVKKLQPGPFNLPCRKQLCLMPSEKQLLLQKDVDMPPADLSGSVQNAYLILHSTVTCNDNSHC